jgi:hypothetical protein
MGGVSGAGVGSGTGPFGNNGVRQNSGFGGGQQNTNTANQQQPMQQTGFGGLGSMYGSGSSPYSQFQNPFGPQQQAQQALQQGGFGSSNQPTQQAQQYQGPITQNMLSNLNQQAQPQGGFGELLGGSLGAILNRPHQGPSPGQFGYGEGTGGAPPMSQQQQQMLQDRSRQLQQQQPYNPDLSPSQMQMYKQAGGDNMSREQQQSLLKQVAPPGMGGPQPSEPNVAAPYNPITAELGVGVNPNGPRVTQDQMVRNIQQAGLQPQAGLMGGLGSLGAAGQAALANQGLNPSAPTPAPTPQVAQPRPVAAKPAPVAARPVQARPVQARPALSPQVAKKVPPGVMSAIQKAQQQQRG